MSEHSQYENLKQEAAGRTLRHKTPAPSIEEQEQFITEQIRMGLRVLDTISTETKLSNPLVSWNPTDGLDITVDPQKYYQRDSFSEES